MQVTPVIVRGNYTIAQEVLLISLASITAGMAEELTVTVDATTTNDVNGVVVTGTPMTNEDAYGFEVYSVWSESTVDAKITEQLNTVTAYFEGYNYSVSIVSTNGTTISWVISW